MTYVTFDPENGDLALQLPDAYGPFREELYARLAEAFMNQDIDEDTLANMNRFVESWIQQHPR